MPCAVHFVWYWTETELMIFDSALSWLPGCRVLFCSQEVQASRLGDQFFVLWVDAIRSNPVTWMASQPNVAREERLVEKNRRLGYSGKYRKRLPNARHELLGSKVRKIRIPTRRRLVKSQNGRTVPKKEFLREIEVLKLKIEWAS